MTSAIAITPQVATPGEVSGNSKIVRKPVEKKYVADELTQILEQACAFHVPNTDLSSSAITVDIEKGKISDMIAILESQRNSAISSYGMLLELLSSALQRNGGMRNRSNFVSLTRSDFTKLSQTLGDVQREERKEDTDSNLRKMMTMPMDLSDVAVVPTVEGLNTVSSLVHAYAKEHPEATDEISDLVDDLASSNETDMGIISIGATVTPILTDVSASNVGQVQPILPVECDAEVDQAVDACDSMSTSSTFHVPILSNPLISTVVDLAEACHPPGGPLIDMSNPDGTFAGIPDPNSVTAPLTTGNAKNFVLSHAALAAFCSINGANVYHLALLLAGVYNTDVFPHGVFCEKDAQIVPREIDPGTGESMYPISWDGVVNKAGLNGRMIDIVQAIKKVLPSAGANMHTPLGAGSDDGKGEYTYLREPTLGMITKQELQELGPNLCLSDIPTTVIAKDVNTQAARVVPISAATRQDMIYIHPRTGKELSRGLIGTFSKALKQIPKIIQGFGKRVKPIASTLAAVAAQANSTINAIVDVKGAIEHGVGFINGEVNLLRGASEDAQMSAAVGRSAKLVAVGRNMMRDAEVPVAVVNGKALTEANRARQNAIIKSTKLAPDLRIDRYVSAEISKRGF